MYIKQVSGAMVSAMQDAPSIAALKNEAPTNTTVSMPMSGHYSGIQILFRTDHNGDFQSGHQCRR